jgi:hypothetical protein
MDMQSYIALGVVGITLVIFVIRIARPNKKGGCGKGCGCGKKLD